MTDAPHAPLHLDHVLDLVETATANRVLRYHGVAEVEGGNVAELLTVLSGMELGRFVHVVGELTAALDGSDPSVPASTGTGAPKPLTECEAAHVQRSK